MKNTHILITGGTSGIGLATAQLLAAEGAHVIVTGPNPEALAAARDDLPAAVVMLASDSASVEAARSLATLVRPHAEQLHAVFFNAGTGLFAPLEATTPQHFDDMFNVNVRGPYFQLQSLLPLLANPSTVLFNASVVAQLGFASTSVYSATKAAVVSLGRTLATELAPRGIRVNTLSPGSIRTPIFGRFGMPPEAIKALEEQMAAQTLHRRLGEPGEVAKLARFLLSADSSFIIGEEIAIDGGTRLT